MEGWYSTGYDKAAEAAKRQTERESNEIPRFWAPMDKPKECVFVDDDCFGIHEHTIKIDGRFLRYTCIGEDNGCVFCREFPKNPRRFAGCFTVVDLTGWKTSRGEIRDRNRISLLSLNLKGIQNLESIKAARQGRTLAGCQFLVAGSQFKYVKEFDPIKVAEKYKPIDYASLLAPLSIEQMQAEVVRLKNSASGGFQNSDPSAQTGFGGGGSSSEFQNIDDIPF